MYKFMNYEKFKDAVRERMEEWAGNDKEVVVVPVKKINGIVYDGLVIQDTEYNIYPTIYLNPFYNKFLNGREFEKIIGDIIEVYLENKPKENFNISTFRDFDKAKHNIIMKLVNTEQNKALLEDVPNRSFSDLSIIYVVIVNNLTKEFATILIHNQHMELWGVTEEDLYEKAMKNTPSILLHRFECMDRVIEQSHMEIGRFDVSMYLLTNRAKINGATCMAYPKMLKRIADFLEDNLIIIPSSVHEVLIIPESEVEGEYTLEDISAMVVEANETALTCDEVLSDHAYHFNRESMEITF